jgi:quercetin dioxygenase-like cupin family protein
MSSTTIQTQSRAGEPLWFLHNLSRILVNGEQSDGRFSLLEMTGASGDMPPLHVHHEEDETFYVLEGEVEVHVAGRDPVTVVPGRACCAPRGIPHAYKVVSSGSSRWLVALTGTSFARLVRDASVPAQTATLPVDPQFDPEEIDAISTRHGIDLLGPPGTLP